MTPKQKYRIWNTHTHPSTMRPTGTACIITKPMDMSRVTVKIMLYLVFFVMPLPCTKLSWFSL